MQNNGQKTCTNRLPEIIKLDLEKSKMKVWTGYIWFRIGTSAGVCAHDSGFLGST